MILNKYC
ncbi:hypothetical protein Zm00014a_005889 [Zea mays]|nr:hypothetical protein Zm00014a_005889 [Zea mays]